MKGTVGGLLFMPCRYQEEPHPDAQLSLSLNLPPKRSMLLLAGLAWLPLAKDAA